MQRDQNPDRRPPACAQSISVVIPSYRSASVLGAALESVFAQSRPADEVIVVDDGGDDDTQEVCRRFVGVRYLRQANAGASTARNRGAAAAGGDWLAFLDADDEWTPNKLERQVQAMLAQPTADFCITASEVWSEASQEWITYAWRGSRDPIALRKRLLIRNIFTGLCSSILIRREAFEEVGGFADGKCCEDRRIAIDLLERRHILILDEALIRQQPGPAHFSNPERHRREMIALIEDYDSLFTALDPTGFLKLRAVSRMHERSGMHYLENGDVGAALYDLAHAAVRWPLQPNPWKALANTLTRRRTATHRRMAMARSE
ncbi:MAG TPA: glycosyltransferase family 2 protein [Phycisphaerae bacterium]|nr:glycosyltransferase family 2 protein [Phycisphaerae bacterium]HRW55573.1 glycosyltransferase family 2 protein [Phycisphaerae bacterium]